MKKTIVLTGGGSAGHVTPNLALVDDLLAHGYSVHYVGTEDGIERSIVHGIPYHSIPAGKLRRYLSRENVKDLFKTLSGYQQAKKILRELSPALVFAKGGFVSVPVVWAAAKLKIPAILHESDYTPGLANRLCIRKAQKVCLSFDTADTQDSKYVFTGSPVRAGLLKGDRKKGLTFLGFEPGKPVLFIMGGSQGAKAVNDVVDSCVRALTEAYNIAHIRGKGNLNPDLDDTPGYRQYEYLEEDLADILAATDIALSRAGANAVFEYLALRIPALLVPLPLSASRGDQLQNAAYFEKHGYAQVLQQDTMTAESLPPVLAQLYANRETLQRSMSESPAGDATKNVLKVIYNTINGNPISDRKL